MWQYNQTVYGDPIMHYGVLGMKWGVRHNPSRAFRKASNKANRLKDRYDKANVKALKLDAKSSKAASKAAKSRKRDKKNATSDVYSDSRRTKRLQNKSSKIDSKASKATKKATKAMSKSMKWEASMSRAFRDTNISDISEKDIAAGRDYIYMLYNDRLDR